MREPHAVVETSFTYISVKEVLPAADTTDLASVTVECFLKSSHVIEEVAFEAAVLREFY